MNTELNPVNIIITDNDPYNKIGLCEYLKNGKVCRHVSRTKTITDISKRFRQRNYQAILFNWSMRNESPVNFAKELKSVFPGLKLIAYNYEPCLQIINCISSKIIDGFFIKDSTPSIVEEIIYKSINGTFNLSMDMISISALPIEPLTPKETEVFNLLLTGVSEKEIADRLNIDINTFGTHHRRIHKKYGVESDAQLITVALINNIITVEELKKITVVGKNNGK